MSVAMATVQWYIFWVLFKYGVVIKGRGVLAQGLALGGMVAILDGNE